MKVLVTGAKGQVGSELILEGERVIGTYIPTGRIVTFRRKQQT